MSAKLIIWIAGKPALHGHKRREFLWSPSHGCYLYNGTEIDPSQFNATYEKAIKTNSDLFPRVKVVSAEANGQSPSTAPLAPARATPTQLITVEQAEAVLARLAPERLKKKTGPKPKLLEVA